MNRGNLKKLYLEYAKNCFNEYVVSETDMPVTDCSDGVMLMDSNVSTDRGINLTNTTDPNCVESATITEYGPSNHIDAMLSKPNMDIENRIESVSRRLCFALIQLEAAH